jgi:hypothetical protein
MLSLQLQSTDAGADNWLLPYGAPATSRRESRRESKREARRRSSGGSESSGDSSVDSSVDRRGSEVDPLFDEARWPGESDDDFKERRR